MTKIRITAVLLLLCLLLAGLSACGPADDSFTVEYVGQPSMFNAQMFMGGKYKGQSLKVDIRAFKDLESISNFEYLDGEKVTFSGTAEGYLSISGGIRITAVDKDGKEHTFDIKSGSRFAVAEKTEDDIRLVLPE